VNDKVGSWGRRPARSARKVVPMLKQLVILLGLFQPVALVADEFSGVPPEVTAELERRGPVIEAVAHRLQANQLAVRYCIDENLEGGKNEGASNPANVHCEVALFIGGNPWRFAAEVSLGQGNVIKVIDVRHIEVQYVRYKDEDSLCCPSDTSTGVLAVEAESLRQMAQDMGSRTSIERSRDR
jgi:hypothetical protein